MVSPVGSTPTYTATSLEQESLEVTSFNYKGKDYTTTPGANYFRALKISPEWRQNFPDNPLINQGIISVHAEVPGIFPRLRIPLSNTRFPVYRRDYVDYDESYWPESQLRNEVSSVQNTVNGIASINETDTDSYLYRRALSDTSSYHSKIYEAKPQIPFNTKTSNMLLPDRDYELNINYTSLSNLVNTWGGGKFGVWIHTLPEEGKEIRDFGQHRNIGYEGWVWSWGPNNEWIRHKVSDLESTSGVTLMREELSHIIDIPHKENEEGTGAGEWSEGAYNNKVLSITKDSMFKTTLKFDTKNSHKNIFNEMPTSFNRHPNGTQSILHRRPTGEQDFQYYAIELFFFPESGGKDFIIESISLIDKTLEEGLKIYEPVDIAYALRYFLSITNSFVGTGDASRQYPATSGTFEESGGSRLDYRINPQWDANTTLDASSNAFTKIDFAEGTCT